MNLLCVKYVVFVVAETGLVGLVGAGLTRMVRHQFLDMLEQSFAHENQQTGARPAGRELYVTPNQMNLGVGSPSAYPLFAGYVAAGEEAPRY